MIITILGWGVLIVIGSILFSWAISAIKDVWYSKMARIKRKGVEEFARRCKDNRYWLNESDRRPFQELYDFILERMEHGTISGQSLRDKVDGIILKKKQTT